MSKSEIKYWRDEADRYKERLSVLKDSRNEQFRKDALNLAIIILVACAVLGLAIGAAVGHFTRSLIVDGKIAFGEKCAVERNNLLGELSSCRLEGEYMRGLIADFAGASGDFNATVCENCQ